MNRLLLRSELKRDEGERLKPYVCTAGKTTIGIGRNLDDLGISEEESIFLFKNDMERVEKEARSIFSNWDSICDARQRALMNLLFALGMTKFLRFKNMIAAVRSEQWNTAGDEALDSVWARTKGIEARAARIANMLRQGV